MIRYLIFGILFFENIISRISGIISRIYIRPHVPVYINIFLILDFQAENLKAIKN